jgi:hypothetical protein
MRKVLHFRGANVGIFQFPEDEVVTSYVDNATSLQAPTLEQVSRALYGVRGQDENFIKRLKNDRHSDRTSDSTFPPEPRPLSRAPF